MNKLIIFNTGSSSLKYKIFEFDDAKNLKEIRSGYVDRIGQEAGPANHKVALSMIFKGIGTTVKGLSGMDGLVAIGHRVVHCGDKYDKTTLIDNDVIYNLKKYNLLAPLHNPKIIEVIEQIFNENKKKNHRSVPNYAIFDSVFYKDMPKVSKIYPLPYEYYQKHGIKKFGFHGISHQYVFESIISRYKNVKKVISVHLGSGSSISAISNNKPIDTSMGFTPLEGLMMLSRSGNIDAGIIHYLIEKKIISHKDVDHVLNFSSGMVGITGIKTDMLDYLYLSGHKVEVRNYKAKIDREILTKEQIERIKLAIDMYVYRIKKYIGEYYAVLGGVDALVFTGKIGYGSSIIRNKILDGLDHITSNCYIEAIETDEEKQIAKEILKVL